jgi:hypothetical protein
MMNCSRLLLVLLCCVVLTSCGSKPVLAPSAAFKAFDMSDIITQAGCQSEGFTDSGTSNAATGIAKHIRSGSFTASLNSFPCYAVFKQIAENFEQTHGIVLAQEGWNPRTEEHPTTPCHVVMKYTHDARHGELHLWLFPVADYSRTGFALHYREEPLR